MKCRTFVIALALWALAWSSAEAQSTWVVSFPANPDHATVAQGVAVVSEYQLVVTPQGGSALAAQALGKPAPAAGVISADVNAYLNGLPPGTYTAIIRAVGPGGQAVSPDSSPFQLVVPAPGAQGAPGISRSGTGLRQIPR